ncbi:SusC/RagA family TonB-linked outer membrane protein [Sphingobacterium paucimobilis]|uniref:TonB-denpendent receptor n=1 Tax=Sphingobacterium paucimobilis HER1398 TaxID=1346330 RepID=U2J5X7_9SPHI|nr:SusC/RagA family TonB-linked outer membrane protein [Sphingobacterium paucimobilis]ERJ58033.1 hypothetical protein M472_04575 [Sphingobacterium paucimobilis HER1398]
MPYKGKLAGVTISSTGGAPGQGANIQIRGINSIDPDRENTPLFVIDGILMDNSTSTSGNRAKERGISNRAVDINPDDIETMNILKGGAATALYGLRGANGVVIITTKSGKEGKLKINYSGLAGFDRANRFPALQNVYTQGWANKYDAESFWPAFGPTIAEAKAIDPTHPDKLRNHFKDAFDTGNQFKNSVDLSGGNEYLNTLVSLSHQQAKGIMPGTDFKNFSGRMNSNFKASDKLKFGTNLNINNSGGLRGRAGRYMEQLVYWSHRHDIREEIFKPDGTPGGYSSDNVNPIAQSETNQFRDDVLRFIGSVNTSYKPLSWLDFNYRFGVDAYRDNRRVTAPGKQGLPGEYELSNNGLSASPGTGIIGIYDTRFRTINSTFMINATKDFANGLSTSLRLGHELYDRSSNTENNEGGDLSIYNWYNMSNAKIRDAWTDAEKYRLMGTFGELALSYNNYLFMNVTGRWDKTSSLLHPRNSFFYPSITGSYVFSEHMPNKDLLSYGKLRLSYAKIGKDALAYSTSNGNAVYRELPTGYTGFTRSTLLGDEQLRPEFTQTYEAGFELKFFNNRLGLDATFYQSTSKDQILKIPVSSTTGYVTAAINAGDMRNRGIELTLDGTAINKENYRWTSSFNFSMNRNKILSLNAGLDEILVHEESGFLSSNVQMKLIPGESYGVLYGRALRRYYSPEEIAQGLDKGTKIDPNRPLLIGANGFPVLDNAANKKKLGNVQPDWIAGWNNNFSYKNISVNVLIDARIGQDRYNQLDNYFAGFGYADYTLNRNDYRVFEGKLADGTSNTKEVWLGQGIDPKSNTDYKNGYYRDLYRGVSEYFVEDASWVRLRSVSVNYSLPKNWFAKTNSIKNASIGLTGNNLALWTKYSGLDPESTSTNSGSNIEGFAGMTYPAVRSFIMSINIGF